MHKRKFLSLKFGVIALLLTVNYCSCAEQQLSRFDQAILSSRLKDIPTWTLGAAGAAGLYYAFPKNMSLSGLYKAALPATLVAASPMWANYVQSLQEINERNRNNKENEWNWTKAMNWSNNTWRYALPPAITAALVTSLGAYHHNSWMRGLLGGLATTAIPAWYAWSHILERQKNADNDAIRILNEASDKEWNNSKPEDLTAVLWALERIDNLTHRQKEEYLQETRKNLRVSQHKNLLQLQANIQMPDIKKSDAQIKIINALLTLMRGSNVIVSMENTIDIYERLRNKLEPIQQTPIDTLPNAYYEDIENALSNLAGESRDPVTNFKLLFQDYPIAMAGVLEEFKKRIALSDAAKIKFFEDNRKKVQSLLEEAQQQAKAK